MGWIIAGLIMLGIIVWLSRSFKTLNPDERGLYVFLGDVVGELESGIKFIPWLPKTYLISFTKNVVNVDYDEMTVVTKAGESRTGDKKYRGAENIKVRAVAYFTFPKGNLQKIFESGVPTDVKKLREWSDEYIQSSVKDGFAGNTWEDAYQEPWVPEGDSKRKFREHDGLKKVGFKEENLSLGIKSVDIPEELKKLLTEVDRQQLESEAAPFESAQRAEEFIGTILESMARLKGVSKKDIQDALNTDADDFIKKNQVLWDISVDGAIRKMGIDGKGYFDIRNQGGSALDSFAVLLKQLGVNNIGGTPLNQGKDAQETKPEEKINGAKTAQSNKSIWEVADRRNKKRK